MDFDPAVGIIGPYFFENALGVMLTVISDCYGCWMLITYFLWPSTNGMDPTEMWFEHDGAVFHIARETLNLLDECFVISRGDDTGH